MHFESGWGEPQYQLIHSPDLGLSFENSISVTGEYLGEACDCCVSSIIGSKEHIAVLFRNNNDNIRDMIAATSPRNILGFSSYTDLDEASWQIFACPSTGGDGVINDQQLYAAYMSGHSGKNLIYISGMDLETNKRIFDRGLMETPLKRVSYNYPRIAGAGDTVGIVWQESSSGDRSVYFSYSTTGIDALGKNRILLSESRDGHQLNPDIGYLDGLFHFTWQDNATDRVKYRSFDVRQVVKCYSTSEGRSHGLPESRS